MCGGEVADVAKVRDEPCWEVGRVGEFEENGKNGRREKGSGDGGPGVCEDRTVAESAFGSCGWVVGWRNGAEKEERDSVGSNEGKSCQDEGCGADGEE